MIDFDLSKVKKNLFAKAFAGRNKNEDNDLITNLYEKGGEAFRDSGVGKFVKKAVTSDFTKTKRDQILDKFGAPEHYKQFAQYLTGGTVGNKDIATLPENVKEDVVFEHFRGTDKDTSKSGFQSYPNRRETILSPKFNEMKEAAKKEAQLTGDDSSYQALMFEDAGDIPNPSYNPKDTLLSTYAAPQRTSYTLGHAQFKPRDDGGYTLTDTYKVDSNESMGAEPYKPLRNIKSDLQEGGQLASRLYDLSKFLGTNQPMKYNVKFDAQRFK